MLLIVLEIRNTTQFEKNSKVFCVLSCGVTVISHVRCYMFYNISLIATRPDGAGASDYVIVKIKFFYLT